MAHPQTTLLVSDSAVSHERGRSGLHRGTGKGRFLAAKLSCRFARAGTLAPTSRNWESRFLATKPSCRLAQPSDCSCPSIADMSCTLASHGLWLADGGSVSRGSPCGADTLSAAFEQTDPYLCRDGIRSPAAQPRPVSRPTGQ